MKKLIAIAFFVLLVASCATSKYTSPRGVRLGMTKEDVVELVGKSCRMVSAKKTPEGIYETMEYIKREKGMNDEIFVYYFFNDELTEWYTDILDPKEARKSGSKPDTSHRIP